MKLVPEGRKKKLRATIEMSLGRMIGEFLKTSVRIIQEGRIGKEDKELEELFNKMYIEFP